MQPLQPQLAAKLAQYRAAFEASCSELFGGGASVTVEMEDETSDVGPAPTASAAPLPPVEDPAKGPATEPDPVNRPSLATASEAVTTAAPGPVNDTEPRGVPSAGKGDETPSVAQRARASAEFDSAPTVAMAVDLAAVKAEIEKALHFIASDFAAQFNARLHEAAKQDPSVEAVSPRYVMGSQHVDELQELLSEPIRPLIAKLDAGDVEGARRATVDAWTPLERRIRSKWQAYFVMTFQDVSVERKAARDRRKPTPMIDPSAVAMIAKADLKMRGMPDFAAPRTWEQPPQRTFSPWIAVAALLALAAAGGWLLMRGHKSDQPQPPATPVTQGHP
ncbi:MAG: hypothetical protein JWN44_1063 [Myxococcales bacterium]|nr:hypothetical protein [Myxococcales bacterium]